MKCFCNRPAREWAAMGIGAFALYVLSKMVAIPNGYVKHDSSETTHTGDVLWQDIVTIPASDPDIVAGGQYWYFFWGDFGSSDNLNAILEMRIVHGGVPTEFTGVLGRLEVSGTGANDKHLFGPVLIDFTQPGIPEDVILQMRTTDGAQTVRAGTCAGQFIRYDADLVEDADYKFAVDDDIAVPVELTNTYQNFASLTWTPVNLNHNWIVLFFVNIDVDNAGSQIEVQLDRDSGAEAAGFFSREGEDFSERLIMGSFWPFTLDNTPHTIAVQAREANEASDHQYSAILALRLNVFKNHTVFTNTGTIDGLGDNTYGEIGAMDISPDDPGNILYFARAIDVMEPRIDPSSAVSDARNAASGRVVVRLTNTFL